MTVEDFKKLAEKHLFVLEELTINKEGVKEMQIFGFDALYEQLPIHNIVGQSEQLNCDHEWKVEAFDCYGMPYEQYCEHCGKKEAI